MRMRSTVAPGVVLAAALALSGCAEFYPYVDPTVRSSDFLFRHHLDQGESQLGIARSSRRDECNRLHLLSRQPTRQALCYVDAKHDEVVSNIRAYTWGHRLLNLAAAGAAAGAAAVGMFGGSRDLALGLGLGAAAAFGLDSLVNVPAYARTYWAGLRGLQCVRGAGLEALGSVQSLYAIRQELIIYQRQLRASGALTPGLTTEFDRVFGQIRSLQVQERNNAVGIVQAADRIVSEINRQVAANEPSSERIMQIARGIAPATQQLGGVVPPPDDGADDVSLPPEAASRIEARGNELDTARFQAFVNTRLQEIGAALPTRLVVASRIQDCRLGGENEFRINPDVDSIVLNPGETYQIIVSGGQGSASAALTGSALSGVRLAPSRTLGAGMFELTAASNASGQGEAIAVFQDQSGQNQRSVVVRIASAAPRPPPIIRPPIVTPNVTQTPAEQCAAPAVTDQQTSAFERSLPPAVLEMMAQKLSLGPPATPLAIDARLRRAVCLFQLAHNARGTGRRIGVAPGRLDALTVELIQRS